MSARLSSPVSKNGLTPPEAEGEGPRLAELNTSLSILAAIFPRILPEVFREMLKTFDGESQLQIVAEQLLKHQDVWVRGRWRKAAAEATFEANGSKLLVAAEDEFRRASYKWATRSMLYEEFKSLSRSKVEGVLAEENFCYTRARPTLQKLSAKSWRSGINAFFSKWRKPANNSVKSHYMMMWLTAGGDTSKTVPILRETGDPELDLELHRDVLDPFLRDLKTHQEARDWETARILNTKQAKDAHALYECECCFSDTTFEQMATCTTGGHVACFQCIWHAVSEALFGQSWGRNIDHVRGQIKCLAATSEASCDGCISQNLAQRAIIQVNGSKEVWSKLESLLAEESLLKARLPLVHCPFCSYAEIDELYFPPSTVRFKINTKDPQRTLFLILLILNFIPLLFLYVLLSHFSFFTNLPNLTTILSNSLTRLTRSRHLSPRFQCLSPTCHTASCLLCLKSWQDPHICHESATLSLRTTIEAAKTSALKRTCPKCNLGFIKDSGCNKLTCVCGYAMCYVCRQGLGKGEGGEGYRHFCQHFRPAGGGCGECERCDLYRDVDDEGVVGRAGMLAEKEWREKEGMVGVEGIGGGRDRRKRRWWDGDWTVQGISDWWVEGVLTC